MNKIDNYCRENKIQLIINIAPITNTTYNKNITNDLQVLFNQDFITQKTKENCFYDSHHMTYIGSYLYSHHIVKKLISLLNK